MIRHFAKDHEILKANYCPPSRPKKEKGSQFVSDQAGFICPELTDCLRNSKEIVKFAATLKRKRIYSCQQLKKEVKLNLSPGLFFRFDQVSKTPMKALERAFEKNFS